MPSPLAPQWAHCGHGANAVTDPVGCRGRRITDHSGCLAHASPTLRVAYLGSLAAGSDLDHRGTPFTETLLADLLNPLRDAGTDGIVIGRSRFNGARFSGAA